MTGGSNLPAPRSDVVFRLVGDDAVLVDTTTNRIFALNGTGARFWHLLTARVSREESERLMLAEYDVPIDELRGEIDQLLEALRARDLVE
jgi:hypothetical protein